MPGLVARQGEGEMTPERVVYLEPEATGLMASPDDARVRLQVRNRGTLGRLAMGLAWSGRPNQQASNSISLLNCGWAVGREGLAAVTL